MFFTTCKGQDPTTKLPVKTAAQDSLQRLQKKTAPRDLPEDFITEQIEKSREPGKWDQTYLNFHRKSGEVFKTLKWWELMANDDLYHLSLPKAKSSESEVVYDVSKYKRNDASKDNNALPKLISQDALKRAHRLSISAPEYTLHAPIAKYAYASNELAYRYVIQKQQIWAIDTIDGKFVSHLELIKIMDAKGKVVKTMEERAAIAYKLSLTNDGKYLLMSDTEIEGLNDEWVVRRKPYILIDLKTNNRYKISIPLDEDYEAGLFRVNEKVHLFELRHSYYENGGDWDLHTVIDPYTRTVYHKSYKRDEKGVNTLKTFDLSTYSVSKF